MNGYRGTPAMAIGDNVLTDGEIKAEQVSILAGEIEELREYIAQLKRDARLVDDCLVPDLTELQREAHIHNGVHAGCLRFLLRKIEEAP